MSTEKINTSTIFTMFEEIKSLLKQSTKNLPAPADSPALTDISTKLDAVAAQTEACREKITVLTETDASKEPIHTYHHHRLTIDIVSNWVALTIVAMSVLLLATGFIIHSQRQNLAQYRDDNLKFRYIKMTGGITADGLLQLEGFLKYNRNPDSIKLIRKNVEHYERLTKQRIEQEEQARLNAAKARQLQNEAETLKNKEK